MASYRQALKSVQEQTERNYAAREEGGGVQEAFAGIFGQLNEDLTGDPRKPLSPLGSLLDTVTDFNKRRRKKYAEAEAEYEQAAFTAGTSLRQQSDAERLDAKMTSDAASRKATNIDIFNKSKPSLQLDEPSNLSFMEAAVASDPSLAQTIANRNSTGHLFRVLPKGEEERIEYGQVIYTHPKTGQKLYSTGDSSAKNLNFAHSRLSKELTKNLLNSGFLKDKIINISSEDRVKLFENKEFRKVLERTVANVPPKLFESHEIYNEGIKKHTQAMTLRLDKELTAINRAIVTQQRTVQKHLASQAPRKIALAQTALDEIKRLEGSQLGLQVGGSYQRAVSAEINKIAFALALMKKEKVTPETAEVNIQAAIQIARNSGRLGDFKRAHEFYYRKGLEKIKQGVTTTKPAPTKPPEGSGKPAVRKKATAPAPRVETTEKAG